MKNKIVFALFLFSLLMILSGCNNQNENTEEITSKVKEDINYLDIQIINLTNTITEENVDWKANKNKLKEIYHSWNEILIRLYKINISNTDILDFSNILDKVFIFIKEENKKEVILELAKLYYYIPKYVEKIPEYNIESIIIKTKLHLINACVNVEDNQWETVKNEINNAESSFNNINEEIDYVVQFSDDIAKTYVTLQELKNSIKTQDGEIYYIKYKNVMEEFNKLKSTTK